MTTATGEDALHDESVRPATRMTGRRSRATAR